MDFEPLRVTAWLSTPLAVTDDWSPALDGLLIKLALDYYGKASSNPTAEDVAASQALVDQVLPLAKTHLTTPDDWYWATSSPCYLYQWEQRPTQYKRWDRQEQHLDWQGRRRKWITSEGNTKSWTLTFNERATAKVDWYCLGNAEAIKALLASCYTLGKKHRTQVSQWQVQPVAQDHHLIGPRGQLMRPVPVDLMPKASDYAIRNWAWRPPYFLAENRNICAMPTSNAVKVARLGLEIA